MRKAHIKTLFLSSFLSLAIFSSPAQDMKSDSSKVLRIMKVHVDNGKIRCDGIQAVPEGKISFAKTSNGDEAIVFDGSTRLKAGETEFPKSFSIFARLRADDNNSSMIIASNSEGGYTKNGFRFFINSFDTNNRFLRFECGNGEKGGDTGSKSAVIPAGQWLSVAVTSNTQSGETYLYVDGQKILSAGSVLMPSSLKVKEWYIGQFVNASGSVSRFKGEISEFRLYTGILSDEEIKALHNLKLNDEPPADSAAASSKIQAIPLLDKYGQYNLADWPDKIKSDADLVADAQKEADLLKNTKPLPADGCDMYGGELSAGNFKATGFFRFEKVDGRWWLVSPEGHLFFLKGMDSLNYTKFGRGTPLKNKDGSPRDIFSELPDKNEFPDAYSRKDSISFPAANLKRKYGQEFRKIWADVTMKRLNDWGFNAAGQWWIEPELKLPYLYDINAYGYPGIGKDNPSSDPFDPRFDEALKNMEKTILSMKDDPYLIGWVFQNENGWGPKTFKELMKTEKEIPAKKAFIDFLLEKIGEAKTAEMLGMSPSEARNKVIANFKIPQNLMDEFTVIASKLYHEKVQKYFKSIDPNHLVFGDAHCTLQSIYWIEAGAPYCDGILLHDYSLEMNWANRHMDTFKKIGKPLMMTEFSFVCTGKGLRSYGETSTCQTQEERGLAYRHYVENIAANPLFAGFSWFESADQSPGAKTIGGENHNFGFVTQCDQPYYELIEEARKTNARVFRIHQGLEKAFTLDMNKFYRPESTKSSKTPLKIQKDSKLEIIPFVRSSIKKENFSPLLKLSWDKDAFILDAEIMDDKFINDKHGEDIWNGDTIEIWFNDAQIAVCGHSDGSAPEAYAWSGPSANSSLKDVKIDFSNANGIWKLSARIPWKHTGITPEKASSFKFAVIVDDLDESYIKAYFPQEYGHSDIKTYQSVILE